jgi:hypothetical protein
MSDEEKRFAAFWIIVFGSAVGFWVIAVHWIVNRFFA